MSKETTERTGFGVAMGALLLLLVGFCFILSIADIWSDRGLKDDLRELQKQHIKLRDLFCDHAGHDWVFEVYDAGCECWRFKCRRCGCQRWENARWLSDSQRKAIRDVCGVEPEREAEALEPRLEWDWMIELMKTQREVADLKERIERLEGQKESDGEPEGMRSWKFNGPVPEGFDLSEKGLDP